MQVIPIIHLTNPRKSKEDIERIWIFLESIQPTIEDSSWNPLYNEESSIKKHESYKFRLVRLVRSLEIKSSVEYAREEDNEDNEDNEDSKTSTSFSRGVIEDPIKGFLLKEFKKLTFASENDEPFSKENIKAQSFVNYLLDAQHLFGIKLSHP